MREDEREVMLSKIIMETPMSHLDAIMYLSGNESVFIRATAFSTLSNLSKYSSQCPSVMAQIKRDVEIPDELTSKEYFKFLKQRLEAQLVAFQKLKSKKKVENLFSGLYCLLRLGQEPSYLEINEAANRYIDFIKQPYNSENSTLVTNEGYFIKVFTALKHSKDPSILEKLLQVCNFYIDRDDSLFQK